MRTVMVVVMLPSADEVAKLRELGADDIFHICDEAGTAFADNALAGASRQV